MLEAEQTTNYDDNDIDTIKSKAESLFQDASGSHDWAHTLRVARLCSHMGPIEHADMDVLLISAYLHDIGRCFQDRSNGHICHAQKGSEMAEDIIRDFLLQDHQKQNILHCIRTHRYRGNNIPASVEAKVLFDADKLDAIGAVGIARAYHFAGEHGARLHNPGNCIENTSPYSRDDTGYREFKVKLCKIKDRMLTSEGRRLAEKRHAFMVAFFHQFIEEYNGKV